MACTWIPSVFSPRPAEAAAGRENQVALIEKEGTVEAKPGSATAWENAYTNQVLITGDRLRTGERSRALLRLLDSSTMRLFELGDYSVEPLPSSEGKLSFSIAKGWAYFFHRDKPADIQIKTRTAVAAIRGTEFHIAVEENGRTVVTLFDGEVDLSNALGAVQLQNGEQGVVDPGQAPVKAPVINAINIIQWALYYPGILEVDELDLDAGERAALAPSLAAYRSGDLKSALASYPAGRQPQSASDKVFLGALLLSVGQVEQSEALFGTIPGGPLAAGERVTPNRLAAAIRRVIAAVKNQPDPAALDLGFPNLSATEWLAESYVQQARGQLPEALTAAREATARSPQFGFAWARVAELQFSFGRSKQALAALDRSLELAPKNAQAVTLRGFGFAAQNRIRAALEEFDRAIALDGALGNAWLGRGLCRIRKGQRQEGRDDLQVAATLEPQRAIFRSYLGKAWNELGDLKMAERELELAKKSDPKDPTAWLYSALLLQQNNRINEAVGELEHSQELNDNRAVYRSRLMLDQDRAVRGANLANIYRDAGMTDWSVREAGKAVNADYANWSAHLFLANSYNALRDPRGVNLRYETPWLSEYLMANLLAPAGAGTLSQQVSQQEYSPLFERNRLGFTSHSEYLSRGATSQSGVVHETLGNTAWALESGYLWDPGERQNHDLTQQSLSLQLKHDLTPVDGIYVQVATSETRTGDPIQYFDPSEANLGLRVRDVGSPFVVAGYHHEWSPGNHTLILSTFQQGRLQIANSTNRSYVFQIGVQGVADPLLSLLDFRQQYESLFRVGGLELQQISQKERHTLVYGAKGQIGSFDSQNLQFAHFDANFQADQFFQDLSAPTADQNIRSEFGRLSGYLFDTWELVESCQIHLGLVADHLAFPRNYGYAPLSDGTRSVHDLLPKIGIRWLPSPDTQARFAWTRSLSGASFDQSFRLEPTQVAGFNQAFRSLAPESLLGANAGAFFETLSAGIERQLLSNTYLTLIGEILTSEFDRWIGAYELGAQGKAFPSQLKQDVKYNEQAISFTLHQLVRGETACGLSYRWSRADLRTRLPALPDPVWTGFLDIDRPSTTSDHGSLHQISVFATINHPSGIFARTKLTWNSQQASRQTEHLASTMFWQWDAQVGWRFARRRAAFTLGILNILDDVPSLHPISLGSNGTRNRDLVTSLDLSF